VVQFLKKRSFKVAGVAALNRLKFFSLTCRSDITWSFYSIWYGWLLFG